MKFERIVNWMNTRFQDQEIQKFKIKKHRTEYTTSNISWNLPQQNKYQKVQHVSAAETKKKQINIGCKKKKKTMQSMQDRNRNCRTRDYQMRNPEMRKRKSY